LDLLEKRLVVFTGISGSGKSSAIQYLVSRFPEITKQGVESIAGERLKWKSSYSARWLLVDEVVSLRDAWIIKQLVERGHRVIAASHLSVPVFKTICLSIDGLYFRTDDASDKLARYISNQGVEYDESSMKQFIDQFGQSYTTLDVVLGYCQSKTLAGAMEYFSRHCTLSLSRQ